MLDQNVIDGLIDAVRFAARTEIMPRFRQLDAADIDTKSGPDDLVTIADKRSEVVIADRVRSLLPDALIIGEEAVATDPSLLEHLAEAKLAVIIDPIDGTNNFAKGLAVFGVILAVVADGQTVFGLLYDPVVDDWIMATRGGGVTFQRGDGTTSTLDAPNPPASVAAAEGYVSVFMFNKTEQTQISKGYPAFARLNSLRCSCHEYRMMALGHADFCLNGGAHPWDHAAGALVLSELGGCVMDAMGAPYAPGRSHAPLWAFGPMDAARRDQIKHALWPAP